MNINKIVKYFLSGLIFVIPVYIVYQVVVQIASLTGNFITNVFLSFAASVILLVVLGYFITKIFNTRFRKRIQDKSKEKTLIGRIFYLISHYKETSEKTKKAFSAPILYKVDSGIYKIGFITSEDKTLLEDFSGDSDVNPDNDAVWVFAPYPINFLGEFVLVDMKNIKKLNKKKEEVIPFILSAGIFKK